MITIEEREFKSKLLRGLNALTENIAAQNDLRKKEISLLERIVEKLDTVNLG